MVGGAFEWSVVMAGALIYVLPVILLYVFLTKYFVWAETGEVEGLED